MPIRRTRGLMTGLALLALLGVEATPARADFIALTNPNQFAPNATLITFDEGGLEAFDFVTNYRGVNFQLIGPTLAPGPQAASDPTPPREFGPGGFEGRIVIANLTQFPAFPFPDVQITLPSPATQFGVELRTLETSGDYTFTLFNGATPVDVVTLPVRGPAPPPISAYFFYAFEDDAPFDRVVIHGPGLSQFVGLDNLRFNQASAGSAVPEPGTLLLSGLGVGLLALARLCRRGPAKAS